MTVNGQKMSKSRGTGISPMDYLGLGMNAEWMRYYLAAKLNSRVEDVDFTKGDFQARVNSDLIGKYVNIASRAAGFIFKRFEGRVSDAAMNDEILTGIRAAAEDIRNDYENREYARAMRRVMELADVINEYVDRENPGNLPRMRKPPTNFSTLRPLRSKASACLRSTSSPCCRQQPNASRSSSTAAPCNGTVSIRRFQANVRSRSSNI